MNRYNLNYKNIVEKHINIIEEFFEKDENVSSIENIINMLIENFKKGNKVLSAGNGGSSSDSQHMASELMGKLCLERNPLPVISLSNDITSITAISNDYDYADVFSRQIKALCNPGEIVILYSTSGNSPNIIKAAIQAKQSSAKVIGFTGNDGGLLKSYCDEVIKIPSNSTQRIQEMHHLLNHIICENVEKFLFN